MTTQTEKKTIRTFYGSGRLVVFISKDFLDKYENNIFDSQDLYIEVLNETLLSNWGMQVEFLIKYQVELEPILEDHPDLATGYRGESQELSEDNAINLSCLLKGMVNSLDILLRDDLDEPETAEPTFKELD